MVSVIKAIFWVTLFYLVAIVFPIVLGVLFIGKFIIANPSDVSFLIQSSLVAIAGFIWFMLCSFFAVSKIDG